METPADHITSFFKSVDFDLVQFLALFNELGCMEPGKFSITDAHMAYCSPLPGSLREYGIKPHGGGSDSEAFKAVLHVSFAHERLQPTLIYRTALAAEVDLAVQHLRALSDAGDGIPNDEAIKFLKQTMHEGSHRYLLGNDFENEIDSVLEQLSRSTGTAAFLALSAEYQLCVGNTAPCACDYISMDVTTASGRTWRVHVISKLERYMLRAELEQCSTLFLIHCYEKYCATQNDRQPLFDDVLDEHRRAWTKEFTHGMPETFVVEAWHTSRLVWDRRAPRAFAFTQETPLADADLMTIENALVQRL